MEIYLKQAILHLIDREAGDPVFSQVPLDLSAEYIRDYLTKKIQKLSFFSLSIISSIILYIKTYSPTIYI